MTVGYICPAGRGEGDEVMTEVDEGSHMLPVVKEIVLQIPALSELEQRAPVSVFHSFPTNIHHIRGCYLLLAVPKHCKCCVG